MLKQSMIKDLYIIIKRKIFWIAETIFIIVICMVSISIKMELVDINTQIFRLSFPLTIIYLALTFIPIGDYHREQSNGCFMYLMANSMDIKTYIYSKGIVLGAISFIPSFIFILISTTTASIVLSMIISILALLFSINISINYAYEIIYSVNPMKNIGKSSRIAMILLILLVLYSRFNISYVSYSILIALLYVINVITLIIAIKKINQISSDSVICRR